MMKSIRARVPRAGVDATRLAKAAGQVLALGLMLWTTSVANAATRAYTGTAPAMYVEYVTIPQYGSVTFETTNLVGSTDPVLHLLRDNGSGSYTQVVYNDDYSGLNSRISYTNPGTITSFVLILRAYNLSTNGTCNLLKNGAAHHSSAPVGGWFAAASLFTLGSGDDMRTVHFPGGSVAPAVLKFSSYYVPTGMALGNAVAGTSMIAVAGTEQYFLFGTPQVKDGSNYYPLRPGATIAMVNDVATDTDGDGVGDALEATLGTCATVSGCGYNAVHGRDTDRDGLSDGEEIWGVAGTLTGGVDDLPFARWGANPRKKDVFVEVDWYTSFGGVVPAGVNPFQWIRDNPTSAIGGWTGTLEQWVDKLREPYNAAPAAHVKNPNGLNGVEVHLDLGVAPLLASNEAKFGAWSTGSARGLVPDFIMVFSAPIDGYVEVTINSESRSFDATGLDPEFIAFGVGYNAVQTGEPIAIKSFDIDANGVATLVIEASTAGVHFGRSITVPGGYESSVTVLKESDASVRNHYDDDPAQVDEVRFGRMRYAVVTGAGGGGAFSGVKWLSGLDHSTFAHELGHTLGLTHGGHGGWENGEVACIPHYFSLMRYGSAPYQFSSWNSAAQINPAEVVEDETLGASFDHSVFLASPYNYGGQSDASGTDWNRDALVSSSATAWRSMAISMYGGSCGAFSQGRENVVPNESVAGSPDLVRHGSRLYMIWASGTTVKYRFASLGSAGDKGCTGDPDPHPNYTPSTSCLTWSSTYNLITGIQYQGVTAYSYGGELFIAQNINTGEIRVRRCSASGTGVLSISQSYILPTTFSYQKTDHTPELVVVHQNAHSRVLGLLYLAQDGNYRSYGWTGTGWTYEGALLDSSGSAIAGTTGPVAKDWPDSGVTGWNANEKRTVAILPSSTGVVRVFALNYSTNRWGNLGLSLGSPVTVAKPFIEYRAVRDDTGLPDTAFSGHFMIGWQSLDSTWGARSKFRLSSLVTKSNPPNTGYTSNLSVVDAGDFLQNVWATTQSGSSTALYSDSTIDNVFGVVPLDVPGWTGINFYPHADGAPAHTYSVWSDFKVMEDGVCGYLGSIRSFNCGTVNVLD